MPSRNEEERHDINDKKLVKRIEDGINMGQLENIFFYLVLDNAKTLFKIERQKKVIEKLAICQSHVQPSVFSIIAINDNLV